MNDIRIPIDIIDNDDFIEFVKSPEYVLYLYLQRHIIRGQRKKDYFNIYKNYYKKGSLATQWKQEVIAKRLKVNERTIRRWMRKLVNRKFIIIKKEIKGKVKKKESCPIIWNICVLGNVKTLDDNTTIESLYYITEFTKKKQEKLLQEINNHFIL